MLWTLCYNEQFFIVVTLFIATIPIRSCSSNPPHRRGRMKGKELLFTIPLAFPLLYSPPQIRGKRVVALSEGRRFYLIFPECCLDFSVFPKIYKKKYVPFHVLQVTVLRGMRPTGSRKLGALIKNWIAFLLGDQVE